MKLLIRIPCIILFALSINLSVAQQSATQKPIEELYRKSVLIELFSSEGCSSCPLADEFMENVLYFADSTKSPIYAVDFHVDIWNRSGWVDPFSDSLYTKRQKTYLQKKNNLAMYTPMAILNGLEQHPGNAKKEVGTFIQKALYQPSKHFLRINLKPATHPDSVMVTYTVWGNTDSLILNVALLQKNVNSQVTAGENKDKILHHSNVARYFTAMPVMGKYGSVTIPLNRNLFLDNFIVIGYIQQARTWEVFATDEIRFKPKN